MNCAKTLQFRLALARCTSCHVAVGIPHVADGTDLNSVSSLLGPTRSIEIVISLGNLQLGKDLRGNVCKKLSKEEPCCLATSRNLQP
uniref:Uncharacterized protein n=1 Tax=Manihot esculenta TaxID=3983 RepID=A0A2C9WCX1_MANES